MLIRNLNCILISFPIHGVKYWSLTTYFKFKAITRIVLYRHGAIMLFCCTTIVQGIEVSKQVDVVSVAQAQLVSKFKKKNLGWKRRTRPPSTFFICFLGRKNQKLVWCPRLVYFYLLWTDLIAFCPALISLRVSAFDATFCPKTKLWEYQTAQTLKSPQKISFLSHQSTLYLRNKWENLQNIFWKYHIIQQWLYTPLASFSVLCLMTWCREDGRIFSVKKENPFHVYILHIECLELMPKKFGRVGSGRAPTLTPSPMTGILTTIKSKYTTPMK